MGQVFGQKGHIRPKGSKYTRWFKIVLKGPILKVYNTYILFITSADGIFITCLCLENRHLQTVSPQVSFFISPERSISVLTRFIGPI